MSRHCWLQCHNVLSLHRSSPTDGAESICRTNRPPTAADAEMDRARYATVKKDVMSPESFYTALQKKTVCSFGANLRCLLFNPGEQMLTNVIINTSIRGRYKKKKTSKINLLEALHLIHYAVSNTEDKMRFKKNSPTLSRIDNESLKKINLYVVAIHQPLGCSQGSDTKLTS